MKTIKWMMGLFVYCVFALGFMVTSSPAAEVQDIQVGRVYYIEGELLRYVPEENDWVAVVRDAPFGTEDTYYSGSKGMAEMIVPNGTWIRTGNNTQIQFIALDPDLSEVDVASGVARIYNKGMDTIIKATSPFGYVLADPGTVFDFYVGENSAEVVAIKGTVSFIRTEGSIRYNVSAGSPSIIADQFRVAAGDGDLDPAWDRWNNNRDVLWSAKSDVKGKSAEYLPPGLRYDAHCLDEHGRWELVPYNGRDYWFWRPTGVYAGWSPFTVGVWTEWWGDQTWIPAEPFGYITHHYGNWVYIGNFWYWAPPVISVRVGFPLMDIGFYWYPGRVSWVHRGIYVGWVPLAPHETYYSRHNWGGPHHRVVRDNVIHIDIRVETLSNVKRAVIVRQDKFHGVENYRDVRLANVHPTVIKKYNVAAVVNNTVINHYDTSNQRYKYANAIAQEKPSSRAIKRVKQNEEAINRDRKENSESVRQQAKVTKEGYISRDELVEVPSVRARTDTARALNRTESGTNPKQPEIKSGAGTAVYRPGEVKTSSTQQTGQSIDRAERVGYISQTKQEKAANQTERGVPSARNQQNSTVTQSKPVDTKRETQQEKTPDQTERVLPSVRGQQSRTVNKSEQINTTMQTQTNRTPTRSDRAIASKSAENSGYRLNKLDKTESSTKTIKVQEKTSQKKSGQTSQRSDNDEEERPKR